MKGRERSLLCKKCKKENAEIHGYCLACWFGLPIGKPIIIRAYKTHARLGYF